MYILTNARHTVLYTGVTSDLTKRLWEHRYGPPVLHRFTSKYNVKIIIYYEEFLDIREAIAREKQIKSWSRGRKEQLIGEVNPAWADLSKDWEQ